MTQNCEKQYWITNLKKSILEKQLFSKFRRKMQIQSLTILF